MLPCPLNERLEAGKSWVLLIQRIDGWGTVGVLEGGLPDVFIGLYLP